MQTGPENPNPALITSHRSLIQQYIRLSHRVCDDILSALEKQLGLQRGALIDLHNLSAQSGDHVRFLKCPSQEKEDRQTAVGSVPAYPLARPSPPSTSCPLSIPSLPQQLNRDETPAHRVPYR